MPLALNLPATYYHANMLFTGSAVPQGAAVTFGGSCGSMTPTSVASAINSAWNTTLKAQTSNAMQLAGTRVKVGPMIDGPFAFVAQGTLGTHTGTSSSPNVAWLIRKNTGIGGRQGSGRIYMPGAADADINVDGSLDPTRRTALQTAWTAFFDGLVAALVPMCLIHSAGAYKVLEDDELVIKVLPARNPTVVTSLTVDNRVATQRRRLR